MADSFLFEDYPQAFLNSAIKDDKLMIDCTMNSADLTGASLYAHDDSDACLLLGSLVAENARLKKSYPLSFVTDSGLDPFRIWFFGIVLPNGDQKFSQKRELPDSALTGAHRTLYNLRKDGSGDNGDTAREYISKISQKINTFPKKELPTFCGYNWHAVDDIKCTFYVSAFEHIVFDTMFVRAFATAGEWYISETEKENIFAVCIYSHDSLPDPMRCVSDCAVSEKYGSGRYHMVCVGLYDDGQYFCSPENW